MLNIGILTSEKKKTQITYENLLHILIEECAKRNLHPDPKFCHMDFEKPAINAVKNTFGQNIVIRGSFYHLTQSTHRKIQKLGFESLYRRDEDFNLFCSMVDAMAFLPITDVPRAVDLMKTKAQREPEQKNIEYFENTYVRGPFVANRTGT